jgi:hypothetical protein
MGSSYLLIAGAVLLLAVLFIEHRLSRISRKLDKTNDYLAQADKLLSDQARYLRALAVNASQPETPVSSPPASGPSDSRARERVGRADSSGPTEL